MSVNLVNGDTLDLDFTAIANTIRTKTGSADTIHYSVGHPENFINPIKTMMVMPTKTASGSLLTISDSADDVQLKEGKFNIAYNSNGLSSMAIARCKKNFFNEDTEEGTLNDTTGVPVPSSTQIRSKTFSACIGGAEYYIYVGSNQSIRVLWYDVTQTFISETINIANTTATAPNNACFFKIRGTNAYGNTYQNDISVNYPSSETSYEAYSGDTYPVSFGTTIYGGYFESETGVLTSTKASDGTDLATPVEYQLAKNDVMLKSGLNNLFCTTGTSEVEYYTPSGGSSEPTFSETVICDNSALGTTLSFTDDYTNYDFIKFEIYNTSSLATIFITTIPSIITEIFTYSNNRINFNQIASNQYVCYQKSTNTSWSKYGNRNQVVKTVTGIKCTNKTITPTSLYSKGSTTVDYAGNITLSDNFYNYDIIMYATHTNSYAQDETQPCNGCLYLGDINLCRSWISPITLPVNYYNSTYSSSIYDNQMYSDGRIFCVYGLKFT